MKDNLNKTILILSYNGIMEESIPKFECELEFLQSLCNIDYIKHLYENKYFNDYNFINYLKYLNYWRNKPYIFYVHFPICLYVLDILNNNNTNIYFNHANSFQNFIYYLKLHWLYFSYQI
ncbi:hypothetical protein PFAG_05858 [Plasmodium falciparum Santa Lucia]|uniref:Mediator of RNA polymerase II transcription subunit 31 n=1 Tax=Plasmodium falciparum Santa Lucia TaxID=478859 RepID=W7FIF8_PLAFA|nr:hypothetical protein PFAG_05858 [Plasmodium falciparum Santa Lucia]